MWGVGVMAQWARFDWKQPLFNNADESILRVAPASAENVYANKAGGFSRFPGLKNWLSLPGAGRVYVYSWRNNLVAVTQGGRIYRIGKLPEHTQDVTGTPLSGGKRPVFTGTEDELVIAAGGPLLRLARDRTEELSDTAPLSTHVAFIDGFLIAIENFSGRFYYSDPGAYRIWNALSVFTAEGKPDDLNSCIVTPYRELLLGGIDSIEQFERLQSGDRPFYRRWATGEGVAEPYTLVADTAGTYGVNLNREFVRFSSQISREVSENVAMSLEAVDDWTDAWAETISINGQRFIVLQAPAASNFYDSKGVTFLFDYRTKRWSFLWGWNTAAGVPGRWPGWSVASAFDKVFVGVDNGIAILDSNTRDNLGTTQRALIRSGHVDEFGPSRIDNVRVRMKRGIGAYGADPPRVALRMIRDNARPTSWVYRQLGAPGQSDMVIEFGGMGTAHTWQMEMMVGDAADYQFVGSTVQVERMSW